MELRELQPDPASLVLSLRDIGYSPQSAVADIVDNSIAAGADSVSVRADWNDGDPWIAIIDNGLGMSPDELVAAMRPGSRSPLDQRDAADLGRFGLGLKTASFAIARSLMVASRQTASEPFSVAEWDLDHVVREGRWSLRVGDRSDLPESAADLLPAGSGTLVLWQKVDRIVDSTARGKALQEFERKLEVVEEHLSLVFHRFLEDRHPPVTQSKLSIDINGSSVVPANPFESRATQWHPEEVLRVDGHDIRMRTAILPHHSRLNPSEFDRLAGKSGYVRNQGFYVYRNFRLIIFGTWFRLRPQRELSRLVRVRVDIPNALDHLWTIDVRKSRASLPLAVRSRLDGLLGTIIESGERVYTGRARRAETPGGDRPIWVREASQEAIRYVIDTDHPLVRSALADLDAETRGRLRRLLAVLSANFPAELFYSDFSATPKNVTLGSTQREDAIPASDLIRRLRAQDFTDAEIRSILSATQPYSSSLEDLERWFREAAADGDSR